MRRYEELGLLNDVRRVAQAQGAGARNDERFARTAENIEGHVRTAAEHSARSAQSVAELVDVSGYSADSLGHLLAVADEYLPQIAHRLTSIEGFIVGISEMLANPAETAAHEKAKW